MTPDPEKFLPNFFHFRPISYIDPLTPTFFASFQNHGQSFERFKRPTDLILAYPLPLPDP